MYTPWWCAVVAATSGRHCVLVLCDCGRGDGGTGQQGVLTEWTADWLLAWRRLVTRVASLHLKGTASREYRGVTE